MKGKGALSAYQEALAAKQAEEKFKGRENDAGESITLKETQS